MEVLDIHYCDEFWRVQTGSVVSGIFGVIFLSRSSLILRSKNDLSYIRFTMKEEINGVLGT